MAEQEEIIIIKEGDGTDASELDSATLDENKASFLKKIDKKYIFIGSGALVVILVLVLVWVVLFKHNKTHLDVTAPKTIEKIPQDTKEQVKPSKLENMIAKADYLYQKGSKVEALALYEKIAIYSEAISAYNLGVAQMKDKQYQNALDNFKKAISNNENRCVSAINAAVCSLELDNQNDFNYYIDLAYAFLPKEASSPLYSYYYTLVNYYKQNYYEALNALVNSSTDEYATVQNNLLTKINTLYGNNKEAIESLEKNGIIDNSFSLGLLYARVGDLAKAKEHFNNALLDHVEPLRSQLALSYINLKMGNISNSTSAFENLINVYGEEVYKSYPIKVNLKKSIVDVDEAISHYKDNIAKSRSLNYQRIFYFSPYKTFNANQVVNHIRKGNASMVVDNSQAAQGYLEKSASASSTNKEMVKAIELALDFKVREANILFEKLVEAQPKNSILHYNLALSYAQLNDMSNAYRHFLRSFNLDAKNYISGIFAIMTSQLIYKDNTKLTSIVRDSLIDDDINSDTITKTLFYISQDNYLATVELLDKLQKNSPLDLALSTMIALKLNNTEVAQTSSAQLASMQSDEIVAHSLYIDAFFGKQKDKEYASSVLNYLKMQKFSFKDLYYGPYIVRFIYVQQNLITGKLYFIREQLKEALSTKASGINEITSTLALASLYDKAYEESFVLYNNLIDNLNVRDAQTLFLAATASIAANHHENAIALLELSKLKESLYFESRFALGLLYLEAKNMQGSVTQFSKFNTNFNSEFFDFDIDTKELLEAKNRSE